MREQTKRCFISYSYDGIDRDKLDYLIHVLKDRLGHNTQILYDQDLEIGDNISRFMKFLDTVDVVIVILTPSYKRKVNDCQGGVYNEFCRIWGRYSGSTFEGSEPLLGEDSPRFKLIPILFSGSLYDSTPQEISDLLFLDLTDLKVTRKSNGQFQIPHHMQRSVGSKMQALASEIVAAIAVKSPSFKKLSASYYDRLFVDLKAKFDDPTFAGHDYLNTILVKTHSYLKMESQLAYFAIGRKGSGKSTLAQVLPLIHPDRYQGIIKITAEEFNLESLYALYSDKQFRSDINTAVPRDRAFEFTWEGLLILATMEAILELSANKQLNVVQNQLIKPIETFISKMKGSPGRDSKLYWTTGDLFDYTFNSTMAFVRDCIEGARTDASVFLVDIGVRFNRERYLSFLFGSEVIDSFRELIRTFNKRFLVTLDGFDRLFDEFRFNSIRMYDEEHLQRRAYFEVDWLRSLLSLVVQAKGRGQDYFYSILDFCIVIPKDRFIEVKQAERDSYRYWHRYCSLNWTGIELAILLRKRLEVLANYETRKDASPRERLEEVLRQKPSQNIPVNIEFEYNGKHYEIPLFMYILRHTFWRPREVLIYYAALLALAEGMKKGGYEVTTEAIRKCVQATRQQIIEDEFLVEFRSTVVNIRDIVYAFRKCPIVMTFETLRDILLPLDFKFASGILREPEVIEKIQFLYEIGFLGVKADKQLMEEFGLHLEHAFCFNEGLPLILSVDEDDLRNWKFVLHPIFSEYLRLDRSDQDLVLQFTWEYLHIGDAFIPAKPDV